MNSVFKRSKDSKKDKKKEKTGSSSKPKKEPKERGSRKVDSPAEEGPPARPPPTPPTTDSGNSADFAAAIANKVEDEEGLVFTGELVNGRPVVKGGNIEKLVERLTYEKYNDTKFVKAFMLTFRSFTTPTELLELLIARFNLTTPDESTIKMIRLRVFNVLKSWLKGGYVDFKQDPALKERLESFIKNEMHPVMENPAVTLQKQIEQCEIAAEKEYEHIFSDNPPQPVIPIPITPANKSNILTYSPKELARQLTLIEYRLFAAINPSECVSQNWMSKQKEKLAPNILKMISRFNDVSCWLASEIVKCVDLPTRTQILKMAIDIAEECWAINNFNAVMEIISGLNSSSVFRLKATWGGLPKKSVAAFEDMHEKMSRDFSYKNSRAVLRTVNPPCIPYLGMYLTDLTFIEEGNPNLLPDGSINFIKRQRLSEVIAEIQTYQYTPYCLAEVSFVRDYILNAESLPEGQCYKLSQKREDKHGNPTVDSPDLPYGDLEVKSSYLFDKPDGDSIIYETKKEVSDGTVVPVIAATIVKLIERLTYHETNQDMNFLSAFLMTYQSFTSGVEILDLLDNRFNMPKPANPSKQQLSKFTSSCMFPIHLRIINLLKSWVTSYPEDFVYDEELQAKFLGLISSWAQQSSKLQATLDTVEKVFEKKMNDPLPTPECRFFGFLYGAEEAPEQAVYYKDKTLLDFDDETLSQQITLIEQNFFSSIRPREALCETFSDEEMQERAPNIWAMKQNYIQLNRWTCTQVLTQPTWQKQFSAVSVLVLTADKLLGNLNFSSAMGITAGLLHLKTELPQIFDWVPNVILEKYKELELLLKNTKRLRMLEKNDDQPTIPFIDLYTLQLSGLFKALSDVAGPGGSLINFEKRRKQWTIFTQLEKYQSRAYQYEYDGACGGFLYHAEIWTPEEIDEKIRGITCPPAPDCRPELIDLHRATKTSSDVDGDQDAFSDGATSPRSETDAEVLSTLSSYLQQIIKVDSSAFADLVQDARTSLAKDLLEDLTSYSERVRDEIAVMQTQLGVGTGGVPAAQRIVSRVFSEGSVLALKQMDTDGQVYGWQDEVVIFKVTEGEDTWLVHVTSHLDKSDISVALRLFTFFSELSNEEYKNAIIASDTTPEAQVILSTRGVRLFNYTGVEVC